MSRKHFLSKQDVRNIRRSVVDRQIKRHENDAMSVSILVEELQQEPFDPILIYKPQGMIMNEHPTLVKDSFVLASFKWNFKGNFPIKFCVLMLPIVPMLTVLS